MSTYIIKCETNIFYIHYMYNPYMTPIHVLPNIFYIHYTYNPTYTTYINPVLVLLILGICI